MAAPFNDQAILDLPESGTYTAPGGASASWAYVNVQETDEQTVVPGYLNLVGRGARISVSVTGISRPQEGGRYTADDGQVWQIAGVVKHALANFYEITARRYVLQNAETIKLRRRDSSDTTDDGLNEPTWDDLETTDGVIVPDAHETVLDGPMAAGTEIHATLVAADYRELRAGDRVTNDSWVSYWTVESMQPYDISLGHQLARVTRIV
jgi:hypothetical protein